MEKLIDKLHQKHTLTAEEYRSLLLCEDTTTNVYLQKKAQQTTIDRFGNAVFIRGLIEISNRCRNNCLYCGIRKGNTMVSRYALSRETILSCCREGYALGFRTFVLQGGEDVSQTDDWIEETISAIRQEFPDCAITLSLGEKNKEAYQRFFKAGANRYLLRHETFNESHYRELHPSEMNRDYRLQCLEWLKEIGYQTGTGIMVGSPGQTINHLVEDLLFIERFQPEMIGIGPFIPHRETPFAAESVGSVELTCYLLSIIRLISPSILLPSTTALGTADPKGREKGILSGANVVMPNLSPADVKGKYELYNNKLTGGAEAAANKAELERRMASIGCRIVTDRGDFIKERM